MLPIWKGEEEEEERERNEGQVGKRASHQLRLIAPSHPWAGGSIQILWEWEGGEGRTHRRGIRQLLMEQGG